VTTVLALGPDPAFLDLTSMPGPTPEFVQAFIDSEFESMCALGYRGTFTVRSVVFSYHRGNFSRRSGTHAGLG
jgi:hypothetical protein